MKKIIEGKRNLLISIVLYCLSISIFLISQLSIVSGTFMSGSVFSYNYPLRVCDNWHPHNGDRGCDNRVQRADAPS